MVLPTPGKCSSQTRGSDLPPGGLGSLGLEKAGKGAAQLFASLPELWERQRSEHVSADVISGPKGWKAPGALDPQVRSRVLDALGIDAQLVFPTFALGQFARCADPDVRYGGNRALNRAMAEFCATDNWTTGATGPLS